MRLRTFFITGFLAAVLAAAASAAPLAIVGHGEHVAIRNGYVHGSTIRPRQAQRIALGVVPNGQLRSTQLERRHGQLVYAVDLATPRRGLMEVDVDARTGGVLSTHRAFGGYHHRV
jgi:uncharacterized membrane protein YkoI